MKKIFLLISACAIASAVFAQNLTILHFNDTHSHIDPERSGPHAGRGGVIEQAAYIDSVRVADGKDNVMLVHAGDFGQGTSYFTELNGDIEIDVLNAMEFDVVCLGNHEFDNGIDELARRLDNLNLPVVCANYNFTGTPLESHIKPYVILEKAGKKIGVIGLLTDVTSVVDRNIADQLKYRNPADVANEYAYKLKIEQKCDLVMCLTHLGYDGEIYTDVELAAASRNVDAIVGGHSHTYLKDVEKVCNLDGEPVAIVSDWKWGLNIGNLKVKFTPNMLYSAYLDVIPEDAFSTGGSWFPYPAYADREGWDKLLGDKAKHLISAGEKYLDYEWKHIPATSYLAFERTGDRRILEVPQGANRMALSSLMMAELAEGKGRFIDQIINGVWYFSYSPSWVLSAHLPRQGTKRSLPDPREQMIDLYSCAVGAQLSVSWHFFHEVFDKIDPVISRSIENAVKKQILDSYINPGEYLANRWLGFINIPGKVINNWNPWCNADVVLCFLLMEKDPVRLKHALRQSARSVDKFLEFIKSDGACDEGPSYWSHAAGKLYDYLQIMHDASGGKYSLFDNKRIKDMGEFISRAYIKNGWVVNFADADGKKTHPASVIYNYGKAVDSKEMMDFALYTLGDSNKENFRSPRPHISTDAYRSLESLRFISEMSSNLDQLNARVAGGESYQSVMTSLRNEVPASTWYPETEFCFMRNNSDWYLAAKGGHNFESHNHNDVGSFILNVEGVPVFVDAGVGTYTKLTFSKNRYTIWTMRSEWHNLPVINGVFQQDGPMFKSKNATASSKKSASYFALDIAEAYPEDAECLSWKREYSLKNDALTITDTYSLKSRDASDVENFMVQGDVYLPGQTTPGGYKVAEGQTVVINDGLNMLITYPVQLKPSVEEKELVDQPLTRVWGQTLKRISYTSATDAPTSGKYVFKIQKL